MARQSERGPILGGNVYINKFCFNTWMCYPSLFLHHYEAGSQPRVRLRSDLIMQGPTEVVIGFLPLGWFFDGCHQSVVRLTLKSDTIRFRLFSLNYTEGGMTIYMEKVVE